MSLRLFLDPLTVRKIDKLISEGKCEDVYEFVYSAIHEKLTGASFEERVMPDNSIDVSEHENHSYATVTVRNITPEKLKLVSDLLKETERSTVSTRSENLYGPANAGLIWIFHNRILPIKIILLIVTGILERNRSPWINFESLREEVSASVEHFVTSAESYMSDDTGIQSILIGFPTTRKQLEKKFFKKKNKEEKILFRLRSSRERFLDQFFGRPIRKGDITYYSGACFEMGLLTVRHDNNELETTITDRGLSFVSLQNPVVGILESKKNHVEKRLIFSSQEREFILNEIMHDYELESRIITRVMKLKTLGLDEFREIFRQQKREYLTEKYSEKNLNKFKDDYGVKQDMLEWLVDKHLTFQATSMMSRLIEIGIVTKESDGRDVRYFIAK